MEPEEDINCNFLSIPFKRTLNFEYLIDEIEQISLSVNHPMQSLALDMLMKLEKKPEFRQPIEDKAFLQGQKPILNQLMSFLFNPLNSKSEMSMAAAPFEFEPFYSSDLYAERLMGDHCRVEIAKDLDKDKSLIPVLYHAYLLILEKLYNYTIDLDIPFNFKITNERDNSVRYFKKKVNSKYLRVKSKKKKTELSGDDIKELFDKSYDLNFWNKKIPLENFEFTGFLKFTYIDITHDFVISQLKSDLLDKDTIVTNGGFDKIKEKIRTLIGIPDVEFGLAATPDKESNLNKDFIWKTIIPRSEIKCEEYLGTIYEKAFREKRIVLTDDFRKLKADTVVKGFLRRGLLNHAVIPLTMENEVIGMIELGSKNPGDLNMFQMKRLFELFPVFTLALKRFKEEWNNKVRAFIQQEFTAIHPTVEWRFREAVASLMDEVAKGETKTIEPIVFPEIVPIYGASDIRGSTTERNIAIQTDLSEQLRMAKGILEEGLQNHEIPVLDDLCFKVNNHLFNVKNALKAGDEVSIIEFLKREINPVLLLLKERYDEMVGPVNKYFQMLDPQLGVLYKKRKEFEKSLTKINDKVSDIIDKEQVKAQKVFPHYFEKYRTDGVEYNAYIGQSLVKDFKYDEIYLKNLRLWQLLLMVKVARKIRKLQPELKTKLDITQLILVHSNPLSIAFRQDENKFDVDGAYNIRYEITKKRIDKALVKGTKERITQVGKIAIIHSHADEINEYKDYIDYMVSKGLLTNNVEELELENLTGASGLRALRVEVDFSIPEEKQVEEDIFNELVVH